MKTLTKAIENLKSGNYVLVAKELLDSSYGFEVYFRAMTNAMRMATNIDFLKTD